MDYAEFVKNITPYTTLNSDNITLAAMGISGKAGEILELIKKFKYQGHELRDKDLINELGDVLFYIHVMCNALNIPINHVINKNVENLILRYPEGKFSVKRSVSRKV